MSGIEGFLVPFLNFELLALVAIGVFVGIYIGAIPGLSVTMAFSLLLSFTYTWDVYAALAVMVGIFTGGVYGSSRTAILLNIPGGPAAMATAIDGYPLAKLGLAGVVMGLSTVVSVIGEFFGIGVMVIASPIVSSLAIHFSPYDYFLLAMMALLLVGSLTEGSMGKALITASLGITIGMVGMDPFTSQPRLTFGSTTMLGGISFIVVMIGLFGLSEALMQLKNRTKPIKQKVDKIIPSWGLVKKYLPLTLRSSATGTLLGALPGTGAEVASLMAYDQAKRTVKKPSRPFGKGAFEGVVAAESANNASIGGAFIPTLTLGIPGDSGTALFLGALYIHGLRPGPMLMTEQPEFFWIIVSCLVISNVFLLIFGLTGIRIFSKIIEIPKPILIPIIITLSIIGSFAINNSIGDVYWMILFGILGYFLKLYRYPLAPLVLGIILTPLIENNLRRGMEISQGSVTGFAGNILTSPISLVLLAIIVLMLSAKTAWFRRLVGKLRRKPSAS
ncbi:hypothetical protein PA598K_01757 [Paenibacillus sp. 598K]|uniref:tripartite tricarboxylate transporter permease n=1 Tax=Paenibacillus sp. 598K TaxID=1117987 RepID=UPI000FFA2665|nr:tripartite tricarboxylate transporter permease [Paenibacillus sp. 598K]GBF73466.1 hypothetical protein PA598K_01757 [Paenibacillus sp. 598K]